MKNWINILAVCCLMAVIVGIGCKKKHINPYNLEPQPDSVGVDSASIADGNFAKVYEKVFEPQCAVSGCHDGTFPPDFRSIYSSYNTLVYEPGLTNDAQGTYTYRVLPGYADSSLLYGRLIYWLPNTSGTMPAYPPDQRSLKTEVWSPDSAQDVTMIREWINNGAKDMYGNSPTLGNLPPQVTGMIASGFSHASNDDPLEINQGSKVDIWFSFEDDKTSPANFTVNEYKLSTDLENFDNVTAQSLTTGSTTTGTDRKNNPNATFTHKFNFDAGQYQVGEVIFVKVYVQDADMTTPVEIPNILNSNGLISYFAIKII